MSRNLHWSVPFAVLLGIIGLFVMSLSFWLGALMILVGLVVPVVVLRQSRKAGRAAPGPQINKRRETALAASTPRRQVDRNKLAMLRYTLHQANLDSNAVVFEAGANKTITVRDILVEMIDIADSHGQPIEALARDIVAIYPRIFEHANPALQRYRDGESAKISIARKAMADLHWKLDEELGDSL